MILQPEHKHNQQIPATITLSAEISQVQRQQQAYSPVLILTQMLNNSNRLLSDKNTHEIKQQIKYRQKKVLLSFSNGVNQYLQHLTTKKINESQNMVKSIIQLQNQIVIDRIQLGSLKVRKLNEPSKFKKINSQLKGKIAQIKSNILSLSSMDRKATVLYQNAIQFKKRGYWMNPSQKSIETKDFLSRMRRIQSEHKKIYQKSIAKQIQSRLIEQNKQNKIKEQQKKQMIARELAKQAQWRKERIHYYQQQQKKKKEIQDLLQKVSPEKPIYIRKQQEFITNIIEPLQQQRQKKLHQIKESHHPIDQEQIDEHIQRYQQYKQSLVEEHRKRNQEENQTNIQIQQELKELYHSKFHQSIKPRFYNSVKLQKQNHRKKISQYGASVLQNFRPPLDPRKKAIVNERIIDLQLLENKNKRKVVHEDGSIVIQDKPQYDARKIGKQYLSKLREDNQGKPRRDRTQSMTELSQVSKVKRIDYLRQNKPNLSLKGTISSWKKVLVDKSYSSRDKYVSIMEQANVMQQKAKQKQQQMRSYKRGDKSIELKGQMDKYYIESVAAKMMVLKDVILKQ